MRIKKPYRGKMFKPCCIIFYRLSGLFDFQSNEAKGRSIRICLACLALKKMLNSCEDLHNGFRAILCTKVILQYAGLVIASVFPVFMYRSQMYNLFYIHRAKQTGISRQRQISVLRPLARHCLVFTLIEVTTSKAVHRMKA